MCNLYHWRLVLCCLLLIIFGLLVWCCLQLWRGERTETEPAAVSQELNQYRDKFKISTIYRHACT